MQIKNRPANKRQGRKNTMIELNTSIIEVGLSTCGYDGEIDGDSGNCSEPMPH